jgi:micrococcal nuclease
VRGRTAVRSLAATLLTVVALPAAAHGQGPTPATVTRVIDGNSVYATLPDGRSVTIRLIGTHAPNAKQLELPEQCGGREATGTLRDLVEGQAVMLTPDPGQEAMDHYGRSLFYVDRGDGLDAGEQLIRSGWAQALWPEARPPQRLDEYLDADEAAERRNAGVWGRCDGDFDLALDEQRRQATQAFVKLYYRRISNHRFLSAWQMLGAGPKARAGPYRRWKAGYRGSLGISVLGARATLTGPRRAFVSLWLRSRDRDACSRRVVRQYFRGYVSVASYRGSWLILGFLMHRTRGEAPRLAQSECPAAKRPAA